MEILQGSPCIDYDLNPRTSNNIKSMKNDH